jgi:hypothetical protein
MNIEVELDRVNTRAVPATVLAPVFAAALFTSAALLFWVQPLIAKMLLPLLGGAPSVWNTCMVFFQALLLAGLRLCAFAFSKTLAEKPGHCARAFSVGGTDSCCRLPYRIVRLRQYQRRAARYRGF